jgi:chemotaxis protein methyltransferase WspC
MNPIEQRLRREIGLDAASVGSSLIQRTIRLRMKALGLQDLNQYRERLTASPPEWEELIEAVVVTETWFFREPEAFNAFIQLVQEKIKQEESSRKQEETDDGPHRPSGHSPFPPPVRILSLPCATGEEPYSLTMALLDAGVSPTRFMTDAADLSPRALERAQRAVYGKNSFRGPALEFRDRHFAPAGDAFQLHDRIRERVTFQRGNLLDEQFLARSAPYDFIFCRNLLIYFDRATQARALQKLHRLLTPRGVLFVGPAEMPLVSDYGFAPAGFPLAFASRKAGEPSRMKQKELRMTPPAGRAPRATAASFGILPSSFPSKPVARRAAEGPLDLNQARALADAGQLAAASALCEAHVQTWKIQNEKLKMPNADATLFNFEFSISNASAAQAYYLLGLVAEAKANEELKMQKEKANPGAAPLFNFAFLTSQFAAALDYYRKALYLDPDHYETLLQVSLLLARQGDARGARTFQRRALRIEKAK